MKRSNAKQNKFNKESNQKVEEFLSTKFIQQMQEDFQYILHDDFNIVIDEKDKQTILFEYPKIFELPYLSQAVRLEIGILATWTPSETVGITPYIQGFYPQLFKGEHIPIRTVSVERTFWEKTTILHHEANRPKDLSMPKRYARHYYDLYCIGNSKCKDEAFAKVDILEKVIQFKQKFYPRTWAKYEEATAEKIRLLPDKYRFKELEDDYNNMKEMFFGIYPNFEEIISGLSKLEIEIHAIKPIS